MRCVESIVVPYDREKKNKRDAINLVSPRWSRNRSRLSRRSVAPLPHGCSLELKSQPSPSATAPAVAVAVAAAAATADPRHPFASTPRLAVSSTVIHSPVPACRSLNASNSYSFGGIEQWRVKFQLWACSLALLATWPQPRGAAPSYCRQSRDLSLA